MKKQTGRNVYDEAMYYVDNAIALYAKAEPDYKHDVYGNMKYLKSAAGTIYAGIEMAAKWYLKIKNYDIKKLKNVDIIKEGLSKEDKKVLDNFIQLYYFFHIVEYYGNKGVVSDTKLYIDKAKSFIQILEPFKDLTPEYPYYK